MKPYSQSSLTSEKRVFNYHLRRARRIVENVFGILSNRFHIFMTPMSLIPEKVETLTLTCCILHNFQRSKVESRAIYMAPGSVDSEVGTYIVQPGKRHQGPQCTRLQALAQQRSNHHSNLAKQLQDILCEYFVSETRVKYCAHFRVAPALIARKRVQAHTSVERRHITRSTISGAEARRIVRYADARPQ